MLQPKRPEPLLNEDEIMDVLKFGLQIYYLKDNSRLDDSLSLNGIYPSSIIDYKTLDLHNIDYSILAGKTTQDYVQTAGLYLCVYPNDKLNAVFGGMIYGNDMTRLSDKYSLSVVDRDDGRFFLYARYQRILGQHLIGELTAKHMELIKRRTESMINNILHKEMPKREVQPEPEVQVAAKQSAAPKGKVVRGDKIARIVPYLKDVEFVDDEACELKLAGKMDSKDYAVLKEVFEEMGGKWNRKSGTHIFDESPMDRISQIIETGEFKKAYNYGYFPTQPELTNQEIIPKIREVYFPGMRLLEPSIGQAHIADRLKAEFPDIQLEGFEINPKNFEIASQRHDVLLCDFMEQVPEPIYDAIVMNPPFERQQDILHVNHAMGFLKPGGTLVAIMASSASFRTDKKSQAFREMVAEMGGQITDNPQGAFIESGTQVNTITVHLSKKPKPAMRM